jgi:hypothetical protein
MVASKTTQWADIATAMAAMGPSLVQRKPEVSNLLAQTSAWITFFTMAAENGQNLIARLVATS